ncbi:MAG: tRNA (adenosine(37)-N6)-threonylcarbamoyltransferase complex dimerization subunit type 1 TsaB, partial [Bacteroidetes bacterium]|nr:tRNA (adenosine(37)-N6)-threonylcarbamoyltransferase complex dimerization subunit type 1 TsaB [Bacteroidota bacterium]
MATILCIETATTNCSVALSVNGSVIALREDNSKGYSHAEKLHVFIEEVLAESKLETTHLDAIAVSKGPGSYTGLRIGVSAAKGLCFALDIPLISLPTLEVLAHKISGDSYIIPILDARRMEVYSCVFNESIQEVRDTRAEVLDKDSFLTYLAMGKTTFIGSGVAKLKTICNHSNAIFVEDQLPSAHEMAALAMVKHKKNDIEDVAYFEPY